MIKSLINAKFRNTYMCKDSRNSKPYSNNEERHTRDLVFLKKKGNKFFSTKTSNGYFSGYETCRKKVSLIKFL